MKTVEPDAKEISSIFRSGENCWRIARADKLALIVDAADYFRVFRSVVACARQELLLVGWDFDFELEMLPGESDDNGKAPDGMPNQLGLFLEDIVDRQPDLNIHMLKWNGAVVAAPGRLAPTIALQMFGSDRIHFALDGHHPFGACHHQKIVVSDGSFAFCGGIDVTEDRWDTSEHLSNDPRRKRKDGTLSEPWHDATCAMNGPAASSLGELSRMRWHRATGDLLDEPHDMRAVEWPENLDVDATEIDVAIARTEPPYNGEPLVNEVEQLFINSIEAASDMIYVESQYLTAQVICDALAGRLTEDNGPEIVIVNPESALSQFEDSAMHVLRGRVIERLEAADHQNRFRIFHPVTQEEDAIYVHAKIMIVDDCILRLGSSNLDDRSMGFDTECDVAIEGQSQLISEFRRRLICEHLDASFDEFDTAFSETGSLIQTIETLNKPTGRGFRRIEQQPEGLIGQVLADTRVMDPRYFPGQSTSTGKGIRPRHVATIAGGTFLAFLGWQAWKRWYKSSKH